MSPSIMFGFIDEAILGIIDEDVWASSLEQEELDIKRFEEVIPKL